MRREKGGHMTLQNGEKDSNRRFEKKTRSVWANEYIFIHPNRFKGSMSKILMFMTNTLHQNNYKVKEIMKHSIR